MARTRSRDHTDDVAANRSGDRFQPLSPVFVHG
jgi:hypothetical protein